MLEINEKNHISVIIGSLNKIYKQAQINGKLNPKDIYYLNIIYKFLNNCHIELTNVQKRCLIQLYNSIVYKSKYTCPPKVIKKYQMSPRQKYVQAESIDCNTYPTSAPKIYYWQETDINTTNTDLIYLSQADGFYDNKLSDTYNNFELGKDITYNAIGRICFSATNSTTIDYEIKDILGLDITDEFDITVVGTNTLFVSKNIISFGDLHFRIKKLSDIIFNPTDLFDNTFDNTFD